MTADKIVFVWPAVLAITTLAMIVVAGGLAMLAWLGYSSR